MAISMILAQHSTASDVPSKLSIFGQCLKESAHDFVAGTVDFFTARRAREAGQIYEGISKKLWIENRTAKSAVALFANAAYFIATPFHDAGTALGEGLAAAIFAKNGIERWEGVGMAALGAVAGANLVAAGVVGARVPITVAKPSTFTPGSGGAMAIATVGAVPAGVRGEVITVAVAAAGLPGSGAYTSQMSGTGGSGKGGGWFKRVRDRLTKGKRRPPDVELVKVRGRHSEVRIFRDPHDLPEAGPLSGIGSGSAVKAFRQFSDRALREGRVKDILRPGSLHAKFEMRALIIESVPTDGIGHSLEMKFGTTVRTGNDGATRRFLGNVGDYLEDPPRVNLWRLVYDEAGEVTDAVSIGYAPSDRLFGIPLSEIKGGLTAEALRTMPPIETWRMMEPFLAGYDDIVAKFLSLSGPRQ